MIKDIHQIEITSWCNLRCKYCVNRSMKRGHNHMDAATFTKALKLVQQCVEQHGQKELNLCGIGESTMHPLFVQFVEQARSMLPNTHLVIASNGVSMTEECAKACADNGVAVYISMHRPEKAGPAINLTRRYGVLHGVSADPSLSAINWAGQVDWEVTTQMTSECPWLLDSKVMVTAIGELTTCSLDGDGHGIIGTVDSDISKLEVLPYRLCASCHHKVPAKFNIRGIAV